jgi:hypothetical protein
MTTMVVETRRVSLLITVASRVDRGISVGYIRSQVKMTQAALGHEAARQVVVVGQKVVVNLVTIPPNTAHKMSAPPPPPPRREYTPSPKPAEAEPTGWSAKMKARGGAWGKVAIDKGTNWSDKLGGRVNDIAEKKFGTEAFYPVTGDFPKEMDKCARLIKAFTG